MTMMLKEGTDAASVASKCVDTKLKGSAPGVMCKLDIKKAFDHKFLIT